MRFRELGQEGTRSPIFARDVWQSGQFSARSHNLLQPILLILLLSFFSASATQARTHFPDLSTKRYKQAAAFYNNSRGFYRKNPSRSDWQKCIVLFQKAYDSDVNHPEIGPKSLYMMGKIYGKAYKQFGMNEDLRVSADYYEHLIFTFPEHDLADDAMVAMGRIVLKNQDKVVNREALIAKALALYTKGEKKEGAGSDREVAAGFLLARLEEHAKEQKKDEPLVKKQATPRSDLTNMAYINRPVRFWSSDNYTRVVIETSAPVRFEDHLLKAHGNQPRRLYVDFFNCRIPRTYQNPAVIQDGLLKRSRGAQFNPTTSRVVIDLETISQYKIFSLHEPFRVVIDITGKKKAEKLIATRLPQEKQYTLAEQFGLGVKTIVVDAGHGGKDPGALGKGGLREKDVVLKVARQVSAKLRKKGYTVIMTRDRDVFIPLEERTAIANTKKADLFVSIHVNATVNRKARGIETYYLSLASTPEEQQAAALENAVSSKQLGELQSILKDILKNSKIKESRHFAGMMQTSMVQGMQKKYSNVKNRGVRKAPFFVLIGAQMPSILVELGFLSNRDEEKRLRSNSYLEALASEIVMGVESYSKSLK